MGYDDEELRLELESKIADSDREILDKIRNDFDYTMFDGALDGPNDIGDDKDLTKCPKCGFKF